MFIGQYQLGSLLPLRLWSKTAADVPTEPDAAPFVQIFGESGATAYATSLPIFDRARITGFFFDQLNLDHRFSPQWYDVFYTWKISGTHFGTLERFQVLPGGDAAGSGIAMHFFRQSPADFVLLQTHDGTLKKLLNPEVRNR